jgi:hypothetical protein
MGWSSISGESNSTLSCKYMCGSHLCGHPAYIFCGAVDESDVLFPFAVCDYSFTGVKDGSPACCTSLLAELIERRDRLRFARTVEFASVENDALPFMKALRANETVQALSGIVPLGDPCEHEQLMRVLPMFVHALPRLEIVHELEGEGSSVRSETTTLQCRFQNPSIISLYSGGDDGGPGAYDLDPVAANLHIYSERQLQESVQLIEDILAERRPE